MKPSRELDVLIAKKVFGHEVVHKTWNKGKCESYTIGEPDYCYTGDEPGGFLTNFVPAYSRDIAAAWEIVNEISSGAFYVEWIEDKGWTAMFRWWNVDAQDFDIHKEVGVTAPHAICLAALKAKGKKK